MFRFIRWVSFIVAAGLMVVRIVSEHGPELRQALDQFLLHLQTAAAESPQKSNWRVIYKQDPMTDQKSLQAKTSQYVDGGGIFDVTAECNDQNRYMLVVTIDYFSAKDQDTHFVLNKERQVPVEF